MVFHALGPWNRIIYLNNHQKLNSVHGIELFIFIIIKNLTVLFEGSKLIIMVYYYGVLHSRPC